MGIQKATTAWRYLNGIVCVYKPAFCVQHYVGKQLLGKVCEDLNKLKCRDLRNYVKVEGDTSKSLSVKVEPNYGDHPLVVGPRYIVKDFRRHFANDLGYRTSGVSILGVNDGTKFAHELRLSHPLKVYHIKARLGIQTDNLFIDGRVKFKCQYGFLPQEAIDRVAASMQAKHQQILYDLTGVSMKSQEAYEMAASGLVRPAMTDAPVVYSMKCIDFNPPEFTLEICTINENEELFLKLIMEVGYHLKNLATTVSMRCVRVAFFSVEHALLKKHWSLDNILQNMRNCRHVIEQSDKFDAKLQQIRKTEFPESSEPTEVIEEDDYCEYKT